MIGRLLFSSGPRRVRAALPLALAALALGALVRRAKTSRPRARKARPLERYLGRRVIVLNSEDPVYAAGRAMEANGTGSVLVERGGAVIGVVTDRDIALQLCSGEVSRHSTLRNVMCILAASATPGSSLEEVLALMRRTGVRRLPLLNERRRAVGIVTLDALLADGAISGEEAGEIIRAQLEQPAEFKPEGTLGPARPLVRRRDPRARRESRAEATLARALDLIAHHTGLPSRGAAQAAFLAVVGALIQRLHPDEAKDLLAQLPSRLRQPLTELPPGPDRSIDLDRVRGVTGDIIAAYNARDIERVLHGVTRSLEELVSPGELRQVFQQLPRELRSALTPQPPSYLSPPRP
jgi:CBS domain-containing protein